MNRDNRVIHRIGARELTREEVENITGGIHVPTITTCTFTSVRGIVGDEMGIETC